MLKQSHSTICTRNVKISDYLSLKCPSLHAHYQECHFKHSFSDFGEAFLDKIEWKPVVKRSAEDWIMCYAFHVVDVTYLCSSSQIYQMKSICQSSYLVIKLDIVIVDIIMYVNSQIFLSFYIWNPPMYIFKIMLNVLKFIFWLQVDINLFLLVNVLGTWTVYHHHTQLELIKNYTKKLLLSVPSFLLTCTMNIFVYVYMITWLSWQSI